MFFSIGKEHRPIFRIFGGNEHCLIFAFSVRTSTISCSLATHVDFGLIPSPTLVGSLFGKECGALHRLKHRYDRGFRGGNKVLRSGIKGESSVVDYIGSIEREVVSQEHWNVEDTYSKDVQICTTLSMHISCAHEGFNRLFEQEVYYFLLKLVSS
ncbi:hypothetical protein PHAVU_001G102000 [Phaseolus vulgaris]|uniref:Uncharacterized protein n=1 Tax=Phaseolus vulgaris TaxID=3885 RepID=V7CUN3_PHAVU|nr:hypothetical protein PHAVU_001G102000g [Phaseolus vulgaris]ESW33829.1 hypothetical protein PHAVU_001G102000g [Phaseolus vulgaris]